MRIEGFFKRARSLFVTGLLASIVVAGCGEDVVAPPAELGPPTNLRAATGELTISLSWDQSPFASSSSFTGYSVYVDTVSIADSTDKAYLDERLVNAAPTKDLTFTVLSLKDGSALQQGKMYYAHVRTVRDNGQISVASNEIDTAPRPEGDNDSGNDLLLMYDYSVETTTQSAYGWKRETGDGFHYPTAEANEELIDFFMVEEANSADNGSELISPAQASFTAGWSVRRSTLFKDLGAGDDAWNTSVAPDTADMTTKVKVELDHTYALRLDDKHWAKVRVTNFEKNVEVDKTGGGTVQLNRLTFTYAFQLINDYGRFKPLVP